MAREAYKCEISASFILNDEEKQLDPNLIKYLLIEHLYESRYMPVIYMSLAMDNDMYSSMIENEKKAKFYLNIKKYNIYSDTALKKDYIKGQFTYLLSASNPNYSQDLVSSSESSDVAYRTLTVALIDMDILNKAKTSFNGVYGEIDQYTLISKAMNGLKNAIIKPPIYNTEFETIIIPPKNSRTKLIKYIFDKYPFYDTNYMFFIDFEKAYLLDFTGDGCPDPSDKVNDIIIDIREVTDDSAYLEGLEIINNAYKMFVNPGNTNVTKNKSIDKVTNQLIMVDTEGEVNYTDLDINNNFDSSIKQTFVRGENASAKTNLYKNIIESNTIAIELAKDNIDGSVITPNKTYNITNYEGYTEYNGKYTLLYKKEIITNLNGQFGMTINIGLKKVGNIIALGSEKAKERVLKSGESSLGRYKSKTQVKKSTSRKDRSYSTSSSSNISKTNTKKTLIKAEYEDKSIYLPKIKRVMASSESQSLKRTPTKIQENA